MLIDLIHKIDSHGYSALTPSERAEVEQARAGGGWNVPVNPLVRKSVLQSAEEAIIAEVQKVKDALK